MKEMNNVDSELLSLDVALYQNTLNKENLEQEFNTIPCFIFSKEVIK